MSQLKLADAQIIEDLLKAKFSPPEYVFLPQQSNGTGANFSRTADATAMSVWPSRGLNIFGFEIKVSRSDWLTELKNPQKAEAVAKFCDFWYLVVSDEKIVQLGELPPTWGLMAVRGNKLKIVKEASRVEGVEMSRSFVASVLRNAADIVLPTARIKYLLDEARQAGLEENQKRGLWEHEQRQRDLDRLRDDVKRFEADSGIKMSVWTAGNIGEAVNVVTGMGLIEYRRRIKDHLAGLKKLFEQIDKAIIEFDSVGNPEVE